MKTCPAGVSALVLAACIFTSGLAVAGPHRSLVLSQFPHGKELARVDLDGQKEFSLSFIHSVSRTRVVDLYQIRVTNIVQTAERFRAHGAGLPSSPDEPGGISWEKQGDEFVLHMERPIPKLVIRTDKNYENRLMLGKQTINLNQWEDQALLVKIECNLRERPFQE